jgi:type VII secretion-associated serine protease mycosin
MAAAVQSGETVRVATVRIAGGRASVQVASATGPAAAEEQIASAQADSAVVAVQLDRRLRRVPLAASEPATTKGAGALSSAAISDDARRGEQWALDALAAERVWTVTRGAGQVVAVLDSGVDATHPDLAGQVLTGTDYVVPGGNGWSDSFGHGTHVAGIVAAVAGNRLGVAGLAPDARILPVRVLDYEGEGWDSDIASGVLWAADRGAGVINLSLGSTDAADAVRAAVAYAVSKGAVVVAAAGNERGSGNAVNYPAGFALPGEVAVAATTRTRVSASYSNTGAYVTLAAPGDDILSTYRGDYEDLDGTSMATPYAAAAAALLRAAAPTLGPLDVVAALTATADDLETPGRDDATGAGLVDPVAALCAAGHCPAGTSPSPFPTASPAVAKPLRLTLQATPSAVVAGQPVLLAVTVRDAAGPVAGAAVRISGVGPAWSGRSDAAGAARVKVTPSRTAVWSATATVTEHTAALTRQPVVVRPMVTVRWRASRVTISVSPAQVVRARQGSSVRARRALPTASLARVTLAAPARGSARVTISAAGGLAAVTVSRP